MKHNALLAAVVAAGVLLSVVALTEIVMPRKASVSAPPPKRLLVSEAPQSQPLAAGSYRASPYAGVLIVPPEGLDEGFVLNAPPVEFPMPILKPKLEFIPQPLAAQQERE